MILQKPHIFSACSVSIRQNVAESVIDSWRGFGLQGGPAPKNCYFSRGPNHPTEMEVEKKPSDIPWIYPPPSNSDK